MYLWNIVNGAWITQTLINRTLQHNFKLNLINLMIEVLSKDLLRPNIFRVFIANIIIHRIFSNSKGQELMNDHEVLLPCTFLLSTNTIVSVAASLSVPEKLWCRNLRNWSWMPVNIPQKNYSDIYFSWSLSGKLEITCCILGSHLPGIAQKIGSLHKIH